VFPASWSVVGSGSIDRAQGGNTLTARWAVNGASTNAPISFWVRAADGRLFASSRHGQVMATGGVAGYALYTNDGKPNPPQQIAAQAQEWAFPTIEDTETSTTLKGTSSTGVAGSVGYMQQPGSQTTVSCTWQFAQNTAVPPPPRWLRSRCRRRRCPAERQLRRDQSSTAPDRKAGLTTDKHTPTGNRQVPPRLHRAAGYAYADSDSGSADAGIDGGPGRNDGGDNDGADRRNGTGPSNFRAQQTGDGTVKLTWDAVPGAGSYMLGGPGTGNGIMVNGLSQTLTGNRARDADVDGGHDLQPGRDSDDQRSLVARPRHVTNTSGRYRLRSPGFRVNRPTFDERINGNGDEDYVAVGLSTIDRRDCLGDSASGRRSSRIRTAMSVAFQVSCGRLRDGHRRAVVR
jgi:hypothetical protein